MFASHCPVTSDRFIKEWEETEETDFLVGQAEKAIRNIGYVLKRNPKVGLPDFKKQAVVACWQLPNSSDKSTAASTERWPVGPNLPAKETVLGIVQPREKIRRPQVQRDGQYRGENAMGSAFVECKNLTQPGICFLEMTFQEGQNQEYYCGTGWLLNHDTVVTAGHNLYDPDKRFHACEVTVSIGITIGTIGSEIVETQQVSTVAVHWGYFAGGRIQNDMAILKLKQPLQTARPIPWMEAPLIGIGCFLRIVGYPGDLQNRRRRGRVMYKSEGALSYDLKDSDFSLHYNLDTYKGQYIT